MDYQLLQLDNQNFTQENTLNRQFTSLLPNASLRIKLADATNLNLAYATRLQIPSVRQLQPLVDNSDPTNIYLGNPGLDPEYIQEWRVDYTTFNNFYFRSLFTGFRLQLTNNNIIDANAINDQLTTQITPINSATGWNATAYYDWRFPFNGIDLKIGMSGNIRVAENDLQVNEAIDRNNSLTLDQTVQLENKYKKKFDLMVGYRVQYNRSAFNENQNFNQEYFQHNYFLNSSLDLFSNWTISLDAEWQHYSQAIFNDTEQLYFLNFEMNRSLFDNRLNVFLQVNNLFDQTISLNRNAIGLQAMELERNRLGRFILVGMSYKLRSFGK